MGKFTYVQSVKTAKSLPAALTGVDLGLCRV
jgi:hypothetical protein